MIYLHDKTIIQMIIKETKSWPNFKEEYNPELESCIGSHHTEKKEIFIQYLMHVGKKFEKDFKMPINDLCDFEKFLFSNENYRDHVLHTFRVWGLGLYFYRKLFKPKFDNKGIDSDRFHFLWYLTAVYHDVGYPLERIETIVKSMEENFKNVGLLVEITTKFTNNYLCSPKIENDLNEIFPGHTFEKNILKKRHGEISARILLFALYEHLDDEWNKSAKKSIKSIIIHDDEKLEITLDEDPLSALLVICDELQEWGRPFSSFSKQYGYELSHVALEILKDENGQNFDPFQVSYKYPMNAVIQIKRQIGKEQNFHRIRGINIKKIE